jgi:hypothetical protein
LVPAAAVLRAADAAARVVVVVGLVRLPVLADLLLGPAVLVPAHMAVLVQRPVPAAPLLAQLPLLAQRAVPELPEVVVALAAEEEPEALVELLSSQSFSAAMARTTP